MMVLLSLGCAEFARYTRSNYGSWQIIDRLWAMLMTGRVINAPNCKVRGCQVKRGWIVLVLLSLVSMVGRAEDAPAEDAPADGTAVLKRAVYIPIKPAFVVNFGGESQTGGRLHFMRVEVTLRVEDTEGGNSVRHHMPYIRNNLIMLLSAQTVDKMDTLEGKELLRQEALAEVAKVLEQEDGNNGVTDLYFNQFVIQK